VNELTARETVLSGDLQLFREKLAQSSARETALNGKLKTFTEALRQFQVRESVLKNKMTELTARETVLSDRQARLSAAQTEVDCGLGVDSAIADLRRELEAARLLEFDRRVLSELEALRSENVRLSGELSRVVSRTALLEAELRESKNRIADLSAQIVPVRPLPAEARTATCAVVRGVRGPRRQRFWRAARNRG
jgi:chromosome segregation ATPase